MSSSPAREVLSGRSPKRLPVAAIVAADFAARRAGESLRSVMTDPERLARALLGAFLDNGSDLIIVFSDVTVEAEALGAGIAWPEGSPPRVERHIDADRIRILDPERDGRMPVVLDAARRIIETLGPDIPVLVSLKGPFSLAALATGLETLLIDALEAPERAREVLLRAAKCQEAYARAIVALGGLPLIGDPFASGSVLGPHHFENLACPGLKHLVKVIHELGSLAAIHICGHVDPVLDSLISVGADLYHLEDADLARAAKSGAVLMGGVPTEVLLSDEEGAVTRAVEAALGNIPDRDRFILATVCDVPTNADPARVREFVEVARRLA
jgi:uroporphyrinogen decarboxylase